MKTRIFLIFITVLCSVSIVVWAGTQETNKPPASHLTRHRYEGVTDHWRGVGESHISDAYIPYDPENGIFGFFRLLYDQHYDTRIKIDRQYVYTKVYATDLLGMPGMLIVVTDPDSEIYAFKRYGDRRNSRIPLKIMEVTEDRKVVYVNNTWSGELYHQLFIVVTSPHREKVFNFELWGFPDN